MDPNFSEYEKELYCRIDELVHYAWDPIGISLYPGARDEYHSYLPEIFRFVKIEDLKSLEILLTTIAVDHMGIKEDLDDIQSIASVMIEWKQFIEAKYNPTKQSDLD